MAPYKNRGTLIRRPAADEIQSIKLYEHPIEFPQF